MHKNKRVSRTILLISTLILTSIVHVLYRPSVTVQEYDAEGIHYRTTITEAKYFRTVSTTSDKHITSATVNKQTGEARTYQFNLDGTLVEEMHFTFE